MERKWKVSLSKAKESKRRRNREQLEMLNKLELEERMKLKSKKVCGQKADGSAWEDEEVICEQDAFGWWCLYTFVSWNKSADKSNWFYLSLIRFHLTSRRREPNRLKELLNNKWVAFRLEFCLNYVWMRSRRVNWF